MLYSAFSILGCVNHRLWFTQFFEYFSSISLVGFQLLIRLCLLYTPSCHNTFYGRDFDGHSSFQCSKNAYQYKQTENNHKIKSKTIYWLLSIITLCIVIMRLDKFENISDFTPSVSFIYCKKRTVGFRKLIQKKKMFSHGNLSNERFFVKKNRAMPKAIDFWNIEKCRFAT